jgi:hypothetical protein
MGDSSSQNGAPSDENRGSLDNSPTAEASGNGDAAPPPPPTGNANVPKPKRLACMICRKRKLKCDGNKPSCSTCTRLNHTCAYDEVRRKSGPKRGYVKALEERLSESTHTRLDDGACWPPTTEQVESLLKTSEPITATEPPRTTPNTFENRNQQNAATASFNVTNPSIAVASDRDMDRWHFNGESPQPTNMDDFNFNSNLPMGMEPMSNIPNNCTWEMIGLGLEEPLPPQETIDEL